MPEPEPRMYSSQWWVGLGVSALTSIRATWSIEKLQGMAAEGHDTPASGDVLAEIRNNAFWY